MEQEDFELLQYDSTSRVHTCKRALSKAVSLLSNSKTQSTSQENVPVKTKSVLRCLQTLTVLLKDVEGRDSAEIGSSCFHEVCVPYLRWLSKEQHSVDQSIFAAALKTVALALNALMEGNEALKDTIISLFVHTVSNDLCSQQSFQTEHHEAINTTATRSAELMTNSVILPTLQFMLESSSVQKRGDAYLKLFGALLKLVVSCDPGTLFLISSTLLPLFIAEGELGRLEKIWDLIKSVHSNKTTVESNRLELLLVLLCCLHDVFIAHDSSSPFSSHFPSDLFETTQGCALLDLRKEESFWAIVQEGLTSSDPLSRKRSMYLLHCVLVSVQRSGGRAVSSTEWVFWWEEESAKPLLAIWNDLVLVLETLEEKQVCTDSFHSMPMIMTLLYDHTF